MKTPRKALCSRSTLTILLLVVETTARPAPQEQATTNTIPTNVFLTDTGRVFWYQRGERLVPTSKIQEALKSNESLPANQDPGGHWGKVVDGLQLSLRFDTQQFTNGEPVSATILMRNVSTNQLTYITDTMTLQPAPINVVVWRDNERLKLITAGKHTFIEGTARRASLFPQTQHKYSVRLDKYYDFSHPGDYKVQAEYDNPRRATGGAREVLASQPVTISVTNSITR